MRLGEESEAWKKWPRAQQEGSSTPGGGPPGVRYSLAGLRLAFGTASAVPHFHRGTFLRTDNCWEAMPTSRFWPRVGS